VATLTVYWEDNLPVLRRLASHTIDLIYIDPPFNTGRAQRRTPVTVVRDPQGDRTGFAGRRYRTTRGDSIAYDDAFDDYPGFLEPRLREAHRILKADGSLFFHSDYREVHYCKVLLDGIFGRRSFINEIIWAYDYGGRAKTRWPPKHDNILWYARDPSRYQYHPEESDRIAYMAPALVGAERAARGKTPTDTWWHTIVSPTGREKTGYPTQKPRGIIDRIVRVHSRPGDLLCDFFAGSGTFGEAACELGRDCILVDESAAAIEVMRRRFRDKEVHWQGSGEIPEGDDQGHTAPL